MRLLGYFALGSAIRFALLQFPKVIEVLSERLELSTALTRFVEVEQEVRWPSAEGAHRPPIITHLVGAGFFSPIVFIGIDVVIALILYLSIHAHERQEKPLREGENALIRKWDMLGRPRLGSATDDVALSAEKDTEIDWAATAIFTSSEDLSSENLAVTITSIYLLSPIVILTCGAQSFAPLTFLLSNASVFASQEQSPVLAGCCLGVVCYLEGPSYLAILGFPLLISSYERLGPRVKAILSFVGMFSGLLYASFLLEGNSWRFVQPSYLWVLSIPDFRPNVGLWWYLMAEMFERYRSYFLFLLHSFIYLVSTPMAVYLRRRPVLHAHLGLAVLQLFQPYPELFHIFTTLLLVFMHPQFALAVPLLGATLLVTCFSLVLQPIMLYTWLDLGSGNANYYYFQCLIVNGTIGGILFQFLVAVSARDTVIRRIQRLIQSENKKT